MRRQRHTGSNRRKRPIFGHRTAASEMFGRLEWVGYGPSLRGDERRLDYQQRPFVPKRRLRAIEPPLGRVASTPALDPLQPADGPPNPS